MLRPVGTSRPTSLRGVAPGLALLGVGTLSLTLGVTAAVATPSPGDVPPSSAPLDGGVEVADLTDAGTPSTDDTAADNTATDDTTVGDTSADHPGAGDTAADGWAVRAEPVAPAPAAPVPVAEPVAPAAVAEPVAPPPAGEVPAIGVRSELVDLDLDAHRRLEVPRDPDVAGWYVRGTRPGQHGAAVLAGHVDSTSGPAVFHRLGELAVGERITVHREDGTSVAFLVDRVERWPKDAFPTDAVYRDADGPELRLITCGGAFDRPSASYRDNVVVFATLDAGAAGHG